MFLKDSNNFNVATANTLTTTRTINGTSFNGSANITTANWGTARNIQIGNTTKSVNGSANVSWSLAEIGAVEANHTHDWEQSNSILNIPPIRKGVGYGSVSEGQGSLARGQASHAEGYQTSASGQASHSEGRNSMATKDFSHAEGYATTASGQASHSEGDSTQAQGNYSHAQNIYSIAWGMAQTVIGKYNNPNGTVDSAKNTDAAFIIGNGTADNARSNAFRVTWAGITYSKGAYNTSGADYAEFFEWSDGNPNKEDRRGYFVAFDTDSNTIRKATSSDTHILGIVSTNAAIIGDNHDVWQGKYVRDEWENIIYDRVFVDEVKETVIDEDGNAIEKVISPGHYQDVPRLNPLYNEDKNYTSRENRPEWSPIGLLGKLLVYSDGTCKVGGFCKPNDDGIATQSNDGYYVLEVKSNNIIKVLIK